MAKTDERDGIHSEAEPTPTYDYRGDGDGFNDQTTPLGDPSAPPGVAHPSDGTSDDSGSARMDSGGGSELDRSDLRSQEGAGATATANGAENDELGTVGKGFRKENKGIIGRMRKRTRRSIAVVLTTGVFGGVGIFGAGYLQGPFQFVHLAQKLSLSHFSSVQNLGENRFQKLMSYHKSGLQRTRLEVTGNYAADQWEKRLAESTGLKPVYQAGTRRLVGFQVIDERKAERSLGNIANGEGRNSARVQQAFGANAEIRRTSDIPGGVFDGQGNRIDSGSLVDIRDTSFRDRRAMTRTLGQQTGSWRITQAYNNRVLDTRAGINRHPLNKVRGKIDASVAKRIQDRRDRAISEGTESADVPNAGSETNAEGDQVTDPADSQASEETKKLIEQFKSGAVKSATGATAVVGVLCTARSIGNSVEDFQYVNNVLPMMRMGMDAIVTGNQVMSGDDVDMGTLGQLTQYLYDKENKTSWTQAASYRAEEGKTGGVAMPEEADLGRLGQKPKLFRTLDSIPGLNPVCGAVDAVTGFFFGLPIIKNVSDFASKAATSSIDAALGLAGSDTNVDELTQKALATIAGKAINPQAKGADYGNLANTGAFLAANDQAVAMGGKDLTPGERATLAMIDRDELRSDNAEKTMVARLFDPWDSQSVASSVIDASPTNPTQAAEMISNPFRLIGSSFSSVFSMINPRASAAAYAYDYGRPKVGFSYEEQKDDLLENPYENANRRVGDSGATLEEDLPRLNEKYGQPCFGITVTTDDSGVHIQTVGEDGLKEVYKNRREKDECKESNKTTQAVTPTTRPINSPLDIFKNVASFFQTPKAVAATETESNNTATDRFKQYRMYIADAMTMIGAACHAGDDKACAEVGFGGGSSDASGTESSGDTAETAAGPVKIKKLQNPIKGSSCNCDIQPKAIVLHWWGSQGDGTIGTLVNIFKGNGLSVQLGITSEGEVWQLTKNLTTQTSHAIGANTTAIGIEIEGGPDQFGKEGIEKYPKKFEAVVATVQYLKDKYNIPIQKSTTCGNVSGILQHKDLNSCPNASGKSDVDDYYFNEVMKRVK
jgi:N-acetylmuramoyl-L-alanine amidase